MTYQIAAHRKCDGKIVLFDRIRIVNQSGRDYLKDNSFASKNGVSNILTRLSKCRTDFGSLFVIDGYDYNPKTGNVDVADVYPELKGTPLTNNFKKVTVE